MTREIPAPATIADLCKATGCCAPVVRWMVRTGRLPGQYVGRKYVISAGEFDSYVEGRFVPVIKPDPLAKAETPKHPTELVTRRQSA